jgi:DNA polymerase-3 subunit epsilon
MSWLVHLFRQKTDLPESVAERLDAWRALPAAAHDTPLERARLVVVDVETSGLDPRRDRLLSIGAVVIENMRLAPQYTFSAVLRNETPSTRENILVHGLTPSAQAAGEARDYALSEFLSFIGKWPCVAFHAAFDRAVLERALRIELGVHLDNPWLDLAPLARGLVPETKLPQGTLDDWLAYFRLRAHVRHNAVHDAQVAAELLLILLQRAQARGITTLAQLVAAAEKELPTGGGITGV